MIALADRFHYEVRPGDRVYLAFSDNTFLGGWVVEVDDHGWYRDVRIKGQSQTVRLFREPEYRDEVRECRLQKRRDRRRLVQYGLE